MATETDPNITYDLFLFAGEPSGDLHGEALIRNLRFLNPSIRICGVGGPKMRKAGMDCLIPMEHFQVMGFIPVFLSLPKLWRSFTFLSKKILSLSPKIALFIDYPGFSLRMEKHLKKRGFKGKLIHYICPSIWAWGKKRIPQMEQNLDFLISIFPFEKKYFSPSFPIKYVGHPLISRIHSHSYGSLDLPPNKKIISLFPGSRKKEINLNFPLQIKALESLFREDPDVIGAVSISQEAFLPLLQKWIPPHLQSKVYFVSIDQTYELMKHSFLAIAKSGTVTLELALHKIPTVVIYAVPSIDLFIAWNILRIRLPFYCIVNIILQKEVFKELIGPHANEENVLLEAKRLLKNVSYREEKMTLCQKVIEELGNQDASQEITRLLMTHLSRSNSIS